MGSVYLSTSRLYKQHIYSHNTNSDSIVRLRARDAHSHARISVQRAACRVESRRVRDNDDVTYEC
jgi:hypothetical protein